MQHLHPVRAATCTSTAAGARHAAPLLHAPSTARRARPRLYIRGPAGRSASICFAGTHAHPAIILSRSQTISQHVDDEEGGDAGGRAPAAAHRRCAGGGGAVGGGARVPAPERGLQGDVHVGPQLRAGVLAGGLGRRQLRRPQAPVQVHQGVLELAA